MFIGKKKNNLDLLKNIVNSGNIPKLINYEPWLKLYKISSSEEMKNLYEQLKLLTQEIRDLKVKIPKIRDSKRTNMAKIVLLSQKVNEENNRFAEMELDKIRVEMDQMNEELDILEERFDVIFEEEKIINLELLKKTIEHIYSNMNEDKQEVKQINSEIEKLRLELNRLRVEKEELDNKIQTLYGFLHGMLNSKDIDKLDKDFWE